MNELVQEGLLWAAMLFPSLGGVLAAVVVVIQSAKKLGEAVQTFTASKEVKQLLERIDSLIGDKNKTDAENAQLHKEIRLLVDELRRVRGYSEHVLGGGDNDEKV